MPSIEPEDAEEIVATVAAGVGALVAAAVSGPLAAVGAAVLPPVFGKAAKAAVRAKEKRVRKVIAEAIKQRAKDENVTEEEIAARLEAKIDDEGNLGDAIWRVARAAFETTNPEVALPLAILLADYGFRGEPADAFFRGVVRLLTEASTRELRDLSGVLNWVLRVTKRNNVLLHAIGQKEGPKGIWRAVPWKLELRVDDPDQPELSHRGHGEGLDLESDPVEDGERLVHLLKSSGLAYEYTGGMIGGGVPQADLRRPTIERLSQLLRLGN
jgi:hypothetical protein